MRRKTRGIIYHVRAEMPDAPRSIINSYRSTCPPFPPDLWTVRTIRIRKIYHALEYPKLPLEPFFRDYMFVSRAVIGFNNYATRVEKEIVSWAFGINKFRAVYFVTLETTFNEDDVVAHSKWDTENRKKARYGAILASSSLKDSFRGLSPEIYNNDRRGNGTVVGGSS